MSIVTRKSQADANSPMAAEPPYFCHVARFGAQVVSGLFEMRQSAFLLWLGEEHKVRGLRLSPCKGGIPWSGTLKGLIHRIARRDSALIRSQFRPKLRYRNPARGMGVQRAKKTRAASGRPLSFTP